MQLDKDATNHTSDSLSSTALTLGIMNRGKLGGRPIDLIAYKQSIQRQMDTLITNGADRESRVAQFIITAQEAAQNLLVEATYALTLEAKASVMKSAMKCLEQAGKQVDRLTVMTTPKTGRLIESVPDKQLPNKAMKLKGKN